MVGSRVVFEWRRGNVKGFGKVRAGAALAATGAILSFAATAQAQRPANLGHRRPVGPERHPAVQLQQLPAATAAGEIVCPAPPAAPTPYCVTPPAPTTSAGGSSASSRSCSREGIKNVELYGYPGQPVPGHEPGDAAQHRRACTALRALGDQYGLRFPGRHGNLTEANWDNQIAAAKILGQDHIGEAGLPGGNGAFNSYHARAEHGPAAQPPRQALGRGRPRPGVLPQPRAEFTRRYMDNGVLKSAWEIVMERTDPRWVVGADRHRLGRLRRPVPAADRPRARATAEIDAR